MSNPIVFDSTATNPGGTGSTITVTLPTHAVGDILYIEIGNTGNTLWTGNPAGWNRIQQVQVGTSANGLVGTWFWRKVVSGDSLPLTNPTFTLGATVTREAFAKTLRGADIEGPLTLPEWSQRSYNTGTANPIRPGAVTTPAPEMLVNIGYFQRAATNAPDQSGYTQDEEIIISGTLVGNASNKVVADQQTALSNQDASPTSGVRWVAGIICVPSPDYAYYRSGSSALTASGTSATPALPTGTSASDNRANKDLIVATVECAGTPTISPNTGADWNEIGGAWSTTTSGNGSTVRKYWTLYDGTLDRQFNRSTTGEIYVYFSVYRNTDQTDPIGAFETQQNASSTTSTFPAMVRTETKSTVQITCIADATPTFTSPLSWLERNDGNGTTCADQVFNAGGTISSASFTLSTASPTLAGQLEILSLSGVAAGSPSSSVSASVSPSASQSPSASESPSVSPSPSASLSPSASISPSVSPSVSPSPSASESPSPSPSSSVSPSVSPSPSSSISPSASLSPSSSESPSLSPSSSLSPSASTSPSLSPSASISPSSSPSPSLSPSSSVSPSSSESTSPSPSASVSPSSSISPSVSPSASQSPSGSESPSISPSASESPSSSPSPTISPSASISPSGSESLSISPSASESRSPSSSISPSTSPSVSESPSYSWSASTSPSISPSASASPSHGPLPRRVRPLFSSRAAIVAFVPRFGRRPS